MEKTKITLKNKAGDIVELLVNKDIDYLNYVINEYGRREGWDLWGDEDKDKDKD